MNKLNFTYVSYIKTTPDELWKALTSADFTRKYWFGNSVETNWKVGAPIAFVGAEGKTNISGTVLVVEKPTTLSYTWTAPTPEGERPETPSKVTFHLEPNGHMMKLTVTHDEFPEGSNVFKRIQNGWPMVLSSLKSLLESGDALDVTSAKAPCEKK